MISLLLDTCVWLALASERELSLLIPKIRSLVESRHLTLIIPEIISSEFTNNRSKIESAWSQRARASLREVRGLTSLLDSNPDKEILDEKLNMLANAIAAQPSRVAAAFTDVESLFNHPSTIRVPLTETIKARATDRLIQKLAPCHRKAEVGDALILEALLEYADHAGKPATWFVTANHLDFSEPEDHRKPHADLSALFSAGNITFSNDIGSTLNAVEPQTVSQEQTILFNTITAFDFARCSAGGYHEYNTVPLYSINPLGGDDGYRYTCRKCFAAYDVSEARFRF